MKTRSVHNPILAVMLSALSVVVSAIIVISVITAPRRRAPLPPTKTKNK